AVDLSGGSVLQLPPFGQVEFDSHAGPLRLNASVQSIDAAGAEELLDSAGQLEELAAEATSQLRVAVIRALASAAACAAGGAALAGWAVFRRPRRVVQSVAVALVPIVTAAGIGSQTLNEQALRQPEFTGLLERAPYLATQGIGLADRLESYRSGVADMVSAVTAVYTATEGLDGTQLAANPDVVTVLHVSDIHLNPQGFDLVGRLLDNFGVDAVVDTGDVTTWGTDVESTTLSRISAIDVPYVFVRGNHDSMRTQKAVAAQSGAVVLDGSTAEVAGIRFAGIGDPTFTPAGGNPALMSSVEVAGAASQRLADVIEASAEDGKPVDVALIHNAAQPYPLFG
ncbi:MAG: phosphohydrolase, partial [Micrococcales bacterium]